jgi:hypothetical protein
LRLPQNGVFSVKLHGQRIIGSWGRKVDILQLTGFIDLESRVVLERIVADVDKVSPQRVSVLAMDADSNLRRLVQYHRALGLLH